MKKIHLFIFFIFLLSMMQWRKFWTLFSKLKLEPDLQTGSGQNVPAPQLWLWYFKIENSFLKEYWMPFMKRKVSLWVNIPGSGFIMNNDWSLDLVSKFGLPNSWLPLGTVQLIFFIQCFLPCYLKKKIRFICPIVVKNELRVVWILIQQEEKKLPNMIK